MKAKSTKKKSEKISTRLLQRAGIAALSLLLLVGGAKVVLASSETNVEKGIKEAVIIHVLEHPESELSLVLAKLILAEEESVLANLEAERDVSLGVLRDAENQGRFERVCSKYGDSAVNGSKFVCEGWGRFALPTSTTTASEVNRIGRDAVVDYAEVELTGTVSSTFYVYVGTATTTETGYANGATGLRPRPDNLIDGYNFVTSSVAVDSPDTLDTYRNIINSVNDAGTLGINAAPFTSSSAVVLFLQNQVAGTNGNCPPGVCEAVTSTNRGYSGFLKYHYRYEIDL